MAADPRPDSADAALAAQFEQIRLKFVAGLARRELEIESAATPQALQEALHRLAGAAGAFGYAALGACAREAMHDLETGATAALATRLDQLKREMGQIRQT